MESDAGVTCVVAAPVWEYSSTEEEWTQEEQVLQGRCPVLSLRCCHGNEAGVGGC